MLVSGWKGLEADRTVRAGPFGFPGTLRWRATDSFLAALSIHLYYFLCIFSVYVFYVFFHVQFYDISVLYLFLI